jgi:hypothetical protein
MVCRSTITAEQKTQKEFQGAMPCIGAFREDLLHVQVQKSAHFCHRYPRPFRTTTKTMRARLTPKKLWVESCRRRWPMLKFLARETLAFLVLHWVNWRAHGDNCDYYHVDQGREDIENPTLSHPAVAIGTPGLRFVAARGSSPSSCSSSHLMMRVAIRFVTRPSRRAFRWSTFISLKSVSKHHLYTVDQRIAHTRLISLSSLSFDA